MGTKKNFVLDTNVILHDYNCLKNFQENDIYLPLVVLEELDKFKKGNEQINFNAREFVRELDVLTSDELFSDGVKLGEGLGRLFVVTSNVQAAKVWESFPIKKPDHLILAATEYLTDKYPKMKSILVTKDVNLRMKARSIGLLCEDYITDKVVNVDVFEKSNEIFENVDPALIDRIYSSKEGIDLSEFDFKDLIHPNECFVLKSDRNSVLARYNPFTHSIIRVMKGKNYGIEPRNAEQSFAFEILNDPNIKLVALTGKAGTGKTLLALAAALGMLEALRHDPDVQLSMVLDAAEAQARYGLSGPFDFVVESSLPIAFGEYPAGDTLWRSCQPGDKKTGVATHGGSPAREEVTTFFAAGPDVRPGTVHGSRSMVDEAPTMAAMLGLTMPDVDGAPIFEILR